MVISEQTRTYTTDEFWTLYGGRKFVELVKGKVREYMPAGGEHGVSAFQFGRHIGNFVDEHNLGWVTAAETGFILYRNPDPEGKDTVRAPDVGFISFARLPVMPDKFIPMGPDFAVEVVSPSDSAEDIQEKLDDYFLPDTGTRLVWVAYPKLKAVVAHTRTGWKRYGIDDAIDGGDVLPGFELPLAQVFR
ncbi:MAG: Uma2 family endonuclease [bacterium]|nr:Uma2 family endonuclease [bacterium]